MVKTNRDGTVLAAVKTPMMPRATSARLPGTLTPAQMLQELKKIPPKDANATRVLHQLARETAGPHDFLAVDKSGAVVKIDPNRTTLEELAVPREVQTKQGSETMLVASFEVQAYAPVGR